MKLNGGEGLRHERDKGALEAIPIAGNDMVATLQLDMYAVCARRTPTYHHKAVIPEVSCTIEIVRGNRRGTVVSDGRVVKREDDLPAPRANNRTR